MSLFLSAGHYSLAPGAAWKGFVEHTEAVLWVQELAKRLPKAIVVPPMELSSKIRFINQRHDPKIKPTLALEIHFNAGNPAARGCETLFSPGSRYGKALAEDIQPILAQFFGPDRGVKPGWFQQDPRKGPLAFLTGTWPTALILEPEYIYNAEAIRANRSACCEALARYLGRFQ